MFESFAKEKQRALELANIVKENQFIDKDVYENSKIEQEIYNLENGDFKIALIAPFSAGKSTFINSLIGQDLLSMEITAETSVITKVRFNQKIRVDIIYRDGSFESIPTDPEESLSVEELKNILETKTTVKGENTEDTIQEVIVHYPIEMCKDKVELVDTPGLFARHEKHEAITSNILPTVNAVIFMIDPESVGEEHFTEVIQNYVRNAKSSNLEVEGRHIFFVINKIDNFEPEDIEKAKNELKIVLQGILNNPQIYEISAYYAMIGKMYLAKSIELLRIQKDRKIKITDPDDPDFTLSGRQITDENAHHILHESRIRKLEKGLENYLESKNSYLISNLFEELEQVVVNSISKKQSELNEIKEISKVDKVAYENNMNNLKNEIKTLQHNKVRDLNEKINQFVRGGSGGNGVSERLGLDEEISDLVISITKKVNRDWSNKRLGINKENAEEKVSSIVSSIDNELEIGAKEVSKNAFNKFNKEIKILLEELEEELEEIRLELENAEIKSIGKNLTDLGKFNLNSVLSTIEKSIEKEFVDIITNVSYSIRDDIERAEEDNTEVVERRGFFYGVKKFFTGRREYDTNFDLRAFKNDIDNIVDEMIDKIGSLMYESEAKITGDVQKAITNVTGKLQKEVEILIKNVINLKQSTINNILKNMKEGEKNSQNIINQLEHTIKELESLKESLSEDYMTDSNEEDMDLDDLFNLEIASDFSEEV